MEDEAFIGIGATVLDGAVVESGAMVAAGALVTAGTRVPSGQVGNAPDPTARSFVTTPWFRSCSAMLSAWRTT